MQAAVEAGYRLIDCAEEYESEAEIGAALQKCFKDGVVSSEWRGRGKFNRRKQQCK